MREEAMHQGSSGVLRDQLVGRIEALQHGCGRLTVRSLCEQLDELRGFARHNGFLAVEGLAGLLESVVAYNGHRQVALTYLSLMRDAALGDSMGQQGAQVYMAAAALRGCR
jgi:hypothetical protein